jgi:hypothetical protein
MSAVRPLARAAALLCLIGAMPASAQEPLGRLFFTPERRAALERQRQLNIQETQQVIEGANLTVSGVVHRSGGKSTAWVNGLPQDERAGTAGLSVGVDRADPTRARVAAGDEASATLKVGESVNRATRETASGIGEGRISVKREGAPGR